ncbi:MAG: T9SS type A sorting domain-containing protein [Bacteroidia bacterium]|nr:T9SS type A sorting domain-containing protein [Bacteroidia bacterium]
MNKLYKYLFIFCLITAFFADVKANDFLYNPLIESKLPTDPFSFTIYPNPVVGDELQISFDISEKPSKAVVFTITNVIGQNLYTYSLKEEDFRNGKFTINLDELKLEKGIYLIKMTSGENSKIQKLVLR